jgi:release factor glutamine methyltransferase
VISKRDEQLLKQHLLGLSREDLVRLNPNFTEAQQQQLNYLLKRRESGEPVAKIIGKKSFWKHDFITNSYTLDPRPESELIIEAMLALHPKDAPLKILDLGTGTGCLLLSLLHEYENAVGVGVDISAHATQVAKQNLSNMPKNLQERADFVNLSWTNLPNALYNVIISNPPYIPTSEIAELECDVKDYDPVIALDGGADGLSAYREIFALSDRLLQKNGVIVCEIGINQHDDVMNIADSFNLRLQGKMVDLAGITRVLSFEKII